MTICLPASKRVLKVWKNSSCLLFAFQKLNVIYQENIVGAVSSLETFNATVTKRVNEVVGEHLYRDEADSEVWGVRWDQLAYGLQQVSLTQTHVSVYEEWIVGTPRGFRCRQSCGMGKAIRWTNNEAFELSL